MRDHEVTEIRPGWARIETEDAPRNKKPRRSEVCKGLNSSRNIYPRSDSRKWRGIGLAFGFLHFSRTASVIVPIAIKASHLLGGSLDWRGMLNRT